ncbi:MAG: four helix bundle protein [Elusimicrobia bacterium]|nr:four helix bundle protein [Candidatus Obscuribacterium magneticum]
MSKKPHEKLDVWLISIELVEKVYQLTKRFPKEENYCLVPQIRRAAISVAANIAEGSSRQTKTELKQFLFIARGSLSELDTELLISVKLGYVSSQEYHETIDLTDRVGKMLTAFINKLNYSRIPNHDSRGNL